MRAGEREGEGAMYNNLAGLGSVLYCEYINDYRKRSSGFRGQNRVRPRSKILATPTLASITSHNKTSYFLSTWYNHQNLWKKKNNNKLGLKQTDIVKCCLWHRQELQHHRQLASWINERDYSGEQSKVKSSSGRVFVFFHKVASLLVLCLFWQPATWFMYFQLCCIVFLFMLWQIKFSLSSNSDRQTLRLTMIMTVM